MAEKLFKDHPPKFFFKYEKDEIEEKLYVAVYEEYEKQINSSVTLTCIFENSPKFNKIILKKTGGRMGFRGSSLSEDQNVENAVIAFILDFGERFGLTIQEEKVSDNPEEK